MPPSPKDTCYQKVVECYPGIDPKCVHRISERLGFTPQNVVDYLDDVDDVGDIPILTNCPYDSSRKRKPKYEELDRKVQKRVKIAKTEYGDPERPGLPENSRQAFVM